MALSTFVDIEDLAPLGGESVPRDHDRRRRRRQGRPRRSVGASREPREDSDRAEQRRPGEGDVSRLEQQRRDEAEPREVVAVTGIAGGGGVGGGRGGADGDGVDGDRVAGGVASGILGALAAAAAAAIASALGGASSWLRSDAAAEGEWEWPSVARVDVESDWRQSRLEEDAEEEEGGVGARRGDFRTSAGLRGGVRSGRSPQGGLEVSVDGVDGGGGAGGGQTMQSVPVGDFGVGDGGLLRSQRGLEVGGSMFCVCVCVMFFV